VKPPYWAVIFSRVRADGDESDYQRIAARMVELAAAQPGFLGMESVSEPSGSGITVCYWDSREAIAAWGRQVEHREAQREGRARFYERYALRIARVEEERGF
jgi:heme-degrading monooxygenase HmoA